MSAPRIEVVERITTKDFKGKTVLIVGYHIIDGDKVIPERGHPAHLFVGEGESLQKKLDEAIENYKKFRPVKYP